MKTDPVTGPISREQLREMTAMPFGEARKVIQKHDPMWGLQPGEKIEFEVIVSGHLEGRAYIKASSKEEADKLADKLTSSEIDWDCGADGFDIESVEPHKPGS